MLLLLAGCDAVGIQRARQAELLGEWDWDDAQSKYPQACGSPTTIRYLSQGKYIYLTEVGTWSLQGQVLTETATDFAKENDMEPPELGRPYVSTLHWLGPDSFAKRYADGDTRTFRRCPFWG